MSTLALSQADILAEAERIVPRRLITGVVWYTPAEWARTRAVSVDPDNFGDSYETWAALVAEEMARLPRYDEVRPVNVTADELVEWCKAHGREIDSQARVEFMMSVIRLQRETLRAAVARNLAREHGLPDPAA